MLSAADMKKAVAGDGVKEAGKGMSQAGYIPPSKITAPS